MKELCLSRGSERALTIALVEMCVKGVFVLVSGHEIPWRIFLKRLKARGARDVQLITSDDHEGLEDERRAVFGSVLWQRCQFPL